MNDTTTELDLLKHALGGMVTGPDDLIENLEFHSRKLETPPLTRINALNRIARDAGSPLARAFKLKLIRWDYAEATEPGNEWTGGTRRNTEERRTVILKSLGVEHAADQINHSSRSP